MVGGQFTVGGRGGNLVLGYEDDNYHDNGYHARNDDNGTANQCAGRGNAFVHIVIS